MININAQIENLQAVSISLAAKVEELNSAILFTDDDVVAGLSKKLKLALDALNEDIQFLQQEVQSINENNKW